MRLPKLRIFSFDQGSYVGTPTHLTESFHFFREFLTASHISIRKGPTSKEKMLELISQLQLYFPSHHVP